MNGLNNNRLGVCSWSLQPATPEELITRLAQTGIPRVQLALDPLRDSPAIWGRCDELFKENGITVLSGMFGCVGEDYSSLESIRLTGGIAPDATWDQNLKNAKATALLAAKLGLSFVAFHAGFVPHEVSDPVYAKMLGRLKTIVRVFQDHQITVGLETGQETASDLLQVLQNIGESNLGVNFDPANMLLYDKGDPIASLRHLGSWVRQVHVKDARRTKVPGTWGEEVPVGTGEVDWPAFFNVLREIRFDGNLVIEREAGDQRVADVQTAREVVLRNL